MPKGKKGFQEGNTRGKGRPKLDEDIKAIRDRAKHELYEIAYDSFLDAEYNVEAASVDPKLSPAKRGMAKMAINFADSGDINIADRILGIFGVPTKAKEVDHKSTDGSYINFLEELTKKRAKDKEV